MSEAPGGPLGQAQSRPHRAAISSWLILSLFVGSFYAICCFVLGLRWFARSTWPVELGVSVSSDRSYPDLGGVIGSLLIIGVATGLLALLVAGAKGSSEARRGAAVLLLLAALYATQHAAWDSEQRRCVSDSYLETDRCISKTASALRDGITWALPATLAAAGLFRYSRSNTRA